MFEGREARQRKVRRMLSQHKRPKLSVEYSFAVVPSKVVENEERRFVPEPYLVHRLAYLMC